jgi:hypothetical protein
VTNGDIKIAEAVDAPLPAGDSNWTGALFAQVSLFKIVHEFHHTHSLTLPGAPKKHAIPMCPLGDLGELGPDRKRISEGFVPSEHEYSSFEGFFGHDSNLVVSISQKPNTHLVVRQDSPRGPDYGPHLWERSGDILLAERIRFNTHKVLAVGFDVPVLGNTWWAFKVTLTTKQRGALLLWINSSISILEFFSRRVVTQGAFVQMKQPAWKKMLVLDVRALTDTQVNALSAAYDKLSKASLEPLSQLATDQVRARIDHELATVLSLPDLGTIRELLGREPGLGLAEGEGEADAEEEEDS